MVFVGVQNRNLTLDIAEYRLLLRVDFSKKRWDGSIAFEVPAGFHTIDLDCDGLEIRRVRGNGMDVPFSVNGPEGLLSLQLPPSSTTTVAIEFAGHVLDRSLSGIYACAHGDTFLLTTQCQPAGARRIFPCIDRPSHKASFRLTVVTDPTLEVISNAELHDIRDGPDGRAWRFHATPRMSTYLFYLAIGRFDRWETEIEGLPVRVLTPLGRAGWGQFAAESATRIVTALEQYYGIAYPLPKLDFISVSDAAGAAMENWGAISVLEKYLLVGPAGPSWERRDVFSTLAHEIAHQWFGDLVTMSWWDDLWLNEGFAIFLESRVTEQIAPQYGPEIEFLLRPTGTSDALRADSLHATHPIRREVERPEEISQGFDAITYGKTQSVLRMLEQHLGAESFRVGVSEYLGRFAYRNARAADLWTSLEQSSGRPVRDLVTPWIERPGLPVVFAALVPGGVALRQQRFTFHGATDEAPWPIPLTMDVDGTISREILNTRERTIAIPESATVHLNQSAVGFYRVCYDPILLHRLLESLPRQNPSSRWSLLGDLSAFLVSGEVDWDTYSQALPLFERPLDRLTIHEVTRTLGAWALAFPSDPPVRDLLNRYLASQLGQLSRERGEGEPADWGAMRSDLLELRASVDLEFAKELAEEFEHWDRLDPDLHAAVALSLARSGDENGYDRVNANRERAQTRSERLALERALGWGGTASLVSRTLNRVRSGEIPLIDLVPVVSSAAVNPAGRAVVGRWMEQNLVPLSQDLRGTAILAWLLEETIPWVGLDRPQETREFFRQNDFPGGRQGLLRGLERLELLERVRRRWL